MYIVYLQETIFSVPKQLTYLILRASGWDYICEIFMWYRSNQEGQEDTWETPSLWPAYNQEESTLGLGDNGPLLGLSIIANQMLKT